MTSFNLLSVETSCDETSLAFLKAGEEKTAEHVEVVYHEVFSQSHLHSEYGGVVPELASRVHSQRLPLMLARLLEVLERRRMSLEDVDYVAVTSSPGLIGSLMVGAVSASFLSSYLSVPALAVDHLEAHIFANFVEKEPVYPFLAMIVSGGHTEFVLSPSPGLYEKVASTIDDAVGEVFDKVARYAGLGYPGGPLIDELSKKFPPEVSLPSPVISESELSFSGLKTAVIRKMESGFPVEVVLSSFQKVVAESLADFAFRLARKYQVRAFYGAGGVMANSSLREKLQKNFSGSGIEFSYPPLNLCVDNALMVGIAALYRLKWKSYALLGEPSSVSPVFD